MLNGLVEGIGATISIIVGGIISDRYESKNKMTKAYIAMLSGIFGIFISFGVSFFPGTNFYVSMFFLFFKYLLTATYMAPTITMMQNTVPPQIQGSIVSAYLFFLTYAGTLSACSLGYLSNKFGALTNPWIYGKVLWFGATLGYLVSIPCFYLAGKSYVRF